jgi:hypothetical protein
MEEVRMEKDPKQAIGGSEGRARCPTVSGPENRRGSDERLRWQDKEVI